MIDIDKIYNEDCLEGMKRIPDKSIDCVICDLPYGMTACKWDSTIPLDLLWPEYERICKETAPIILFSSGLFTFRLVESNPSLFRYKLIWKKNVPTGMCSAKSRPMKYYEEICVFGQSHSTYNPQMKERVGKGKSCYNYDHYCGESNHVELEKIKKRYDPDKVQPSDVLEFDVVPNRKNKLHPTQKPVDLVRYLIKTYSNEGELILDNCMGSGTTAIACMNEKRHFIGFENDLHFFETSAKRIEEQRHEQENSRTDGR